MMNSKLLAQSLVKISQQANTEKSLKTFFNFLKKKNLTALLPQIKVHVQRELGKRALQDALVITTKHDLSQLEIDKIISLVGAPTDVVLEVKKDESLIGGFSAVYQGNIYDGSLRNQITQLRKKLTR